MTLVVPKELAHARELINQARFGEALEIVEQFEKIKSLSSEDQLLALLTKARIYSYNNQFEEQVKISDIAFQMSQDLGLESESIEALIGKAYIAQIGDLDMASTYVLEAKRRLKSLADDPSKMMLRRGLLQIKSFILFSKGNLNRAVKSAQECLKLTEEEKLDNKLDLADAYMQLGWIKIFQANPTKASEYAMKSLEYRIDLHHAAGIASCYALIAYIHQFEGDYDQSMHYCEIPNRARISALETLSNIYRDKSELKRALKYRHQAVTFAEELKIPNVLAFNLFSLGELYLLNNENEKGVEYFERCMNLAEKWGLQHQMALTLCYLTILYTREESRAKANRYFSRLSDLYDQTKMIEIYPWYLGAKALMMKTSTRMRDRMEAQSMFKELIDRAGGEWGEALIFSIANLCDLLLEELSMNNDPEILNEIMPLIDKSLEMAEETRNYRWLANSKLLQGKLALIQMNIEEAKLFLTQAQRIAELHGLTLLAQEVSKEHDKLFSQLNEWEKLQKTNAPMSERIKLASTNGVLERIQGKRAVEPSELVEEVPILLLIMDNSGTTFFNHPFIANWDHSDLFSNFMSAFNIFMDEIFSKSIDRIRVGENTILINPIEQFLACYIIKGQSYPALQKLTRFTEAIKENSEIWDALNKAIKTSEMLELDKPPELKTVIDEIFT
ncbi:MAG: tetratricopeptide repeat protein [Promethearchaeota archaeon]|jgi:hypothetical protein